MQVAGRICVLADVRSGERMRVCGWSCETEVRTENGRYLLWACVRFTRMALRTRYFYSSATSPPWNKERVKSPSLPETRHRQVESTTAREMFPATKTC